MNDNTKASLQPDFLAASVKANEELAPFYKFLESEVHKMHVTMIGILRTVASVSSVQQMELTLLKKLEAALRGEDPAVPLQDIYDELDAHRKAVRKRLEDAVALASQKAAGNS